MNKRLLTTGAILGVLGIVLGAFAAHGLEAHLTEKSLKSFETGVRYQMYHAFLLLLLGGTSFISIRAKQIIFYLVLLGIVLFSGSIYGLATNVLTTLDFKTIALVTPIGGLLLISAWICLIINILKHKMD